MSESLPKSVRPDQAESWLLSAALGENPVEAFEQWRNSVVIDDIEWPSLQILPRLYKNLSGHGVTGAEINIARGLHRKIWYQNQLNFDTAMGIYDLLIGAGIKVVPLKGMALCIGWLDDPGMRQMGDVDFLIPVERVPEASALLNAHGWRHKISNREGPWDSRVINYLHSEPFENSAGYEFDLHWTLFPETVNTDLGSELLGRTRKKVWKKREFYLLDDEDMVFQLCVHGVKPSSTKMQWIADVYTVLSARDEPLPWERVLELAVRFDTVLWLRYAIHILHDFMPGLVGDEIVEEVDELPVSEFEKHEVAFLSRIPNFLGTILLKYHRLKLKRAVLGDRINKFKDGDKPSFLLMLKFLTGKRKNLSLLAHYFKRLAFHTLGKNEARNKEIPQD